MREVMGAFPKQKISFVLIPVLLVLIASLMLSSPVHAEDFLEITVKEGDYLIRIGEDYLDNPHQWREIARINRLKNPDLIYPNQVIVIPVRLLKGTAVDGVVTFVKGDVRVRGKNSEEWQQLHLHDRVREGSIIKVGDRSAAEIEFNDGSSCFQQSNTLLRFPTMRKKGDRYEHRLSLQKGRMISKIRKATGREPRFEIETPSAVCAARGTAFRVSADDNEYTRSEVLEGSVEVEAMDRKEIVLTGEGTLIRRGEPPVKPRKLLPPPKVIQTSMPADKLPLRFVVDPVQGSVTQRIMITVDKDGKDMVYEHVVGSDEGIEVDGLSDGVYYLHALSIDEIGLEGLPSQPTEVHVRMHPLPPRVEVPIGEGKYGKREISCSWQVVNEAVAYHYQIAQDSSFERIIDEKSSVYGTNVKTPELDYGTYFFRVRSIAGDGYQGIWSETISFTIAPDPPPMPAAEMPRKVSFRTFLGIVAAFGVIFSLLP